jgi:hypothetical protein
MNSPLLSHAGRHLLNRRDFLRWGGTGLGGIALATLLAEQRLLGASGPWRPGIDPRTPHAPRPPHFEPKAKRVLMIFCSGAISHIDTFDYKPELIRLHDRPMPGAEGLITGQGMQGNVIKPLWDFKPRGQSGKMVSDLLPNLAELTDDMCFIHSMTARSAAHGPAENQASARGRPMRWAARVTTCRRSWRFPIRVACRRPVHGTGRRVSCQPRFRASRLTPTNPSRTSIAPRGFRPTTTGRHSSC